MRMEVKIAFVVIVVVVVGVFVYNAMEAPREKQLSVLPPQLVNTDTTPEPNRATRPTGTPGSTLVSPIAARDSRSTTPQPGASTPPPELPPIANSKNPSTPAGSLTAPIERPMVSVSVPTALDPTAATALEPEDREPNLIALTPEPDPAATPTAPPTAPVGPPPRANQPLAARSSLPALGSGRPPQPSASTEPPLTGAPQPTAEPGGTAIPAVHTVADGETLIAIARTVYGDPSMWTRIRDANPGVDANRLLVGQTLQLPPRTGPIAAAAKKPAPTTRSTDDASRTQPAPSTPSQAREARTTAQNRGAGQERSASRTYTVGRGDTLKKIAQRELGDSDRWRDIYDLNKDRLRKPNQLEVGMTLRLPAQPKKRVEWG